MTETPSGPVRSLADALGSRWWLLLVVGLGWVVVGFVVLRFDSATVAVVSVVLGMLLLLAAAGEVFRASLTAGGWRFWHVVFAALLLVAAVTAFADPGGTFVSLALVTGFAFVVAGAVDIVSSLFAVGVNPAWWLQLLSGVAQVVLGVIASGSLADSVVVLVTAVSVLALFRGMSEIAAAFSVRSVRTALA